MSRGRQLKERLRAVGKAASQHIAEAPRRTLKQALQRGIDNREFSPSACCEQPHEEIRADGQRKMSSILDAAMEVFAKSGVDAPVREIAERAEVGLGTVYRHFQDPNGCLRRCGEEPVYARRMVELLVDGLRYGASTRTDMSPTPDARRNRKAPAK